MPAGEVAMNEAGTCRKFAVPMLQAARWDDEPHAIAEQRTEVDALKNA
jgi:type I restriction enzyme, R subunit